MIATQAFAVLDGSLYAVGGVDGSSELNSVEKYDPKTNQWRNVQSMSSKRFYLGVAVLDGSLYAVGGSNYMGKDNYTFSASVEKAVISTTSTTSAAMSINTVELPTFVVLFVAFIAVHI